MNYLQLEDVLSAFEHIELLPSLFPIEKIDAIKHLEDKEVIENFNRTIRNNPYRLQGLINLVDNINFFLEKNYCLIIEQNEDLQSEDGRWTSIRKYFEDISFREMEIGIIPKIKINEDTDIDGDIFHKDDFNSKKFAQAFATRCMFIQKVDFITKIRTQNKGINVYEDKNEKYLIVHQEAKNSVKFLQVCKNKTTAEIIKSTDDDLILFNQYKEKNKLFSMLGRSKEILLNNFGNPAVLVAKRILDEGAASEKSLQLLLSRLGSIHLTTELAKYPEGKDLIGKIIDRGIEELKNEEITEEGLLSLENTVIFKEIFNRLKETGFIKNKLEEKFSQRRINIDNEMLEFVKNNDLLEIIDKKEELFEKLIEIYKITPFNLDLVNKLLVFGNKMYYQNNREGIKKINMMLGCLFFNKKEPEDLSLFEDLKTTYELSKKVKEKDLIPYWLAIIIEAYAIELNNVIENDEVVMLSPSIQITKNTYRIIKESSDHENWKLNTFLMNNELREIGLVNQLSEKSTIKNKKKI